MSWSIHGKSSMDAHTVKLIVENFVAIGSCFITYSYWLKSRKEPSLHDLSLSSKVHKDMLQLQCSPKFLKILDPPLIFVLLRFIEIAWLCCEFDLLRMIAEWISLSADAAMFNLVLTYGWFPLVAVGRFFELWVRAVVTYAAALAEPL